MTHLKWNENEEGANDMLNSFCVSPFNQLIVYYCIASSLFALQHNILVLIVKWQFADFGYIPSI